jgi:hypothetical protein
MEERERRKKSRDAEVDRRRGPAVEEQDEAKMLEDDEEVCLLFNITTKLIDRSSEG